MTRATGVDPRRRLLVCGGLLAGAFDGKFTAPRLKDNMAFIDAELEKSEWLAGETQSTPIGTPRASDISGVIFAAGRTPPCPGLAPWLSLISIIFT